MDRQSTLFAIGLLMLVRVSSAQAHHCPAPVELVHEAVTVVGPAGTTPFKVEIADTAPARAAGLMCRSALAEGTGMLFVFPKAQVVRMWMKNTRTPLDILFVAADGRIVRIVANVQPGRLEQVSSGTPVIQVLELPPGSAARHQIQLGDRLRRARQGLKSG